MSDNEIVKAESPALNSALAENGIWSSISGNDFGTKLQVLKAVNDAKPIKDFLQEIIPLTNIVIQGVDSLDEDSGEVQHFERVILIDEEGNAYVGASKGLMNSARTILSILGHPSGWPAPLPVTVTREQGSAKNRDYFTINIA